jgi:hypothetical protein
MVIDELINKDKQAFYDLVKHIRLNLFLLLVQR